MAQYWLQIVAHFALQFNTDGPLQCSGLDVVRYDDKSLHDEFGEGFQMLGSEMAEHNTPMGTRQQFLYCWCRA